MNIYKNRKKTKELFISFYLVTSSFILTKNYLFFLYK